MSENRQFLPASPRLDHLKGQAKALLNKYKAGDFEAAYRISQHLSRLHNRPIETVVSENLKLADTQFVIAREYGFSSWAKLKQHVERLVQPSGELIERFKTTVEAGDSGALRRLLQTQPSLKAAIDDPLFGFDSPAIVKCKADRAMVDVLLEFGASLDARSRWWAGGFGVLDDIGPEMGRYLIERGATVDVHAAASLGLLEKLKEIIAVDPQQVNTRGGDGQTPLHFAQTPEIIDFLLDHGAEIDARDIDHHGTPSQYAINDTARLSHLLQRGATPDIFIACAQGDEIMVRRILKENPHALTTRIGQGEFTAPGLHIYAYLLGYTARPLSLAAERGHDALIAALWDSCSSQEQFLYACQRADEDRVQSLLSTNPNLVQSLSPEDRSLICEAAWRNDVAAVGVMLRAGFDVNARGVHNSTPLDRAALWGYLDVVELCLTHGASVTIKNEFGGTPLGACLYGSTNFCNRQSRHAECLERLLQAGAILPAQASGSPECLEILHRHGVPN